MNEPSQPEALPDSFVNCHTELLRLLHTGTTGVATEAVEVAWEVERYRRSWRPKKTRLVLLAESHVFTTQEEFGRVLGGTGTISGQTSHFVRFVYCLGYGENRLLNTPVKTNPGTWQFRKIFYSCVNTIVSNSDFAPIVKSGTDFPTRVKNKLNVLSALREVGVWLVDASIAAVYRPGRGQRTPDRVLTEVLRNSWRRYTRTTVESEKPEGVLCIGMKVRRSLRGLIEELGIPVGAVPQPGAFLSAEEHLRILGAYQLAAQNPSLVERYTSEWRRVENN